MYGKWSPLTAMWVGYSPSFFIMTLPTRCAQIVLEACMLNYYTHSPYKVHNRKLTA